MSSSEIPIRSGGSESGHFYNVNLSDLNLNREKNAAPYRSHEPTQYLLFFFAKNSNFSSISPDKNALFLFDKAVVESLLS